MPHQGERIVGQVVQHLQPGGIETMVLALLKHQPFYTVIFSLEGCKDDAIKRWPILAKVSDRLVFLEKPPGFTILLIWQLVAQFKLHRVNAVHTHHIGPLLYGGLAARLANITKHIHTEHDAWHLSNKKQRYLQKLLLHTVKPIMVADAYAVKDKIKLLLNHSDTTLIHNGIDITKYIPGDRNIARKRLNLPTGVVLIGNAGRLETVKGQDVLISALSQFSSTIHLAIAGGGSLEKQLKAQVSRLQLEQQVHFLGPIDDMTTFYQSLDLFCLPSRHEGLPLSPMEAQACGIPALITNVGGSAEALCHNTGLLVERDNVEQLVLAIETMLSRCRSTSPRCFITKHRTAQGMANAYVKLIYS